MRLFAVVCLAIIQSVCSGSAQVRRTIAPSEAGQGDTGQSVSQKVLDRRAAHRIAQSRRQARIAAATTPVTANERRAAIVVLSTPAVVDHLVATSPRKADARGVQVPDTTTVRARMFSSEGDQYVQSLRNAKAPLAAQLEARGATVFGQTEHVLNAIMVHAAAADLAWLRQQPGVQSAEFSAIRHVNLNAATALIGAQTVWNQLGGSANAGKGQMIAMLDSGIDNSIPMFSTSGFTTPLNFPKTNATAGSGYTNGKVIVAKNYICPVTTSSCPNFTGTSAPATFDENASDGFGHGTGTASVAAGNCTGTPAGVTICGVAPGAYLGNYKVFDSTGGGTDAAFLSALNDAVADGFTIINYSGGQDATVGTLPTQSTDYAAIHSAVAANAVVVVSAGNCGPLAGNQGCGYDGDNTITDPGIVPDAITPGASSNSHIQANPFTVTSSATVPANIQSLSSAVASSPAFNSIGPAVVADVTPLDGNGTGCTALPAGSLTGQIALMRYSDDCVDSDQTNNAAAAGAIASIIADNYPEELGLVFGLLNGGNVPSTFITYYDANNLLALANANPGKVMVSFGASTVFAPQIADAVADYSSRGPQNDLTIKPDLVTPGDVYVASQTVNRDAFSAIYDPSGYLYSSGTSYSAPMTSGAIAIIKGQHPSLTPHDLKSMVSNTATLISSTQDNAVISVMNQGGGRLNVPAALATTLTSDPVAFSFGQVMSPASGTNQSMAVTLKNIGSGTENFSVTVNQQSANASLQVITDKTTVSLGGGQSTTLNLKLALSAALYGVYEGTVVLTSQSTATVIHIPYWIMLGAPTISTGGLVDGASFAKTVSPGDIVSVFGTALGSNGYNASYLPLQYDLNHTNVQVFGNDSIQGQGTTQSVPLFYSSSGQVNFQIPYSLVAGCPHGGTGCDTVNVYLQGIAGNSINFQVVPASPGVFVTTGNNGIMVHASTNALVTTANPATAGEIVTIYCAGLGAVNSNYPWVYEGDPAPIPAATTAATATVKIGGTAAAVSFSGLSPNFAGLYQINATVGSGTPTGTQPLTITIGGVTSAAVNTFVH
jgi:uncharacterized protein (TIGR03437 family)